MLDFEDLSNIETTVPRLLLGVIGIICIWNSDSLGCWCISWIGWSSVWYTTASSCGLLALHFKLFCFALPLFTRFEFFVLVRKTVNNGYFEKAKMELTLAIIS